MAVKGDGVPGLDSETHPVDVKSLENGATSAHQQTTVHNGGAHSPPPRDSSGDRLSPESSHPRLGGALKKPHGSALRPTSSQQNEQSFLSSHTRRGSDGLLAATNGLPETPIAGRKSVQFSRDTADDPPTEDDNSRPPSLKGDRPELQSRTQSLMSKLRAITTSQGHTHTRSTSTLSATGRQPEEKELDTGRTPRSARNEPAYPMTVEEDDSEADADAEESAADGQGSRTATQLAPRKRRRKARRGDDVETAPSSPHSPIRPGFFSAQSLAGGDHVRPQMLSRSATDTDVTNGRQGLSEDEGRRRMDGQESPWRRKHAWKNFSYGGQRKTSEGTPEGVRRPLTLRNFANITSHTPSQEAEGETPKTPRRRGLGDRGTTFGAAKWKQLGQTLKLLGQSKKKDRTIDHEKSAELLAELQAGGPAVLMLASMFQRDEHGARRIPVLLEQLKVSITDSEVDKTKEPSSSSPGERHLIFRIELEYGSGINRMKWVVKRSLRDFVNLHAKYKFFYGAERFKGRSSDGKGMPKFPRNAFPWLESKDMGNEEEGDDEVHDTDGAVTDNDATTPKHIRRPSYGFRKTTAGALAPGTIASAIAGPGMVASAAISRRDGYEERRRKKLEVYLQKMIKFFLFRPESNRLCKFLEISALGMRLAAEGSYHGKEGYLVIRSAKGLDFRKAMTPSNLKGRHSPKWFLVRHSYVVCVDSPEDMHIYDVFLFDSDFKIQYSKQQQRLRNQKARELAHTAKENAKHPQHHRLKLQNSERKLKLLARNERQLLQFEESIKSVIEHSPWARTNRFDSFAPVRPNCFAQWLVDGRDYMWVVSRAISQAKDVIYIHDWWLSPELYMRRPPAISAKWRLDRLLKRKAEEGVKIFVIVYRNIESAIPIDSSYTKFSLLDLHPNVFVQRSPNQFRQNTFFWAHHEKLCIVDHTLAFIGGIDLCFGRWDTPQHTVVDDKSTGFEASDLPKDADHCQLWPGKDYSNPRVQDFYALNKPYEEMYDRTQVARMPWHDISMQVVGQPARDLTRHFVQRWNYILRQRKPTRPTPFLLPPPDFNSADLEALGLDGTCEVQVLRSAGPWSLGTPDKTEHSIMNAYIKMIEQSDHFVYIENQFFISSCETEQTKIHNLIGDALVERIIRAYKNDEAWRATIVIPLIPGFQNTVAQEGGSSVRLIMMYQYASICRGDSSIFGRLRAQGIEPADYIEFYALRTWGKIGPKKALVTEQLYIHAKCMVVDDRIAIIGSANINERSMLGNRDSETAAVVRDTDMLMSRMNGKPYKVGRFPHTLRMRLMREHLGLDVDEIMEDAQIIESDHRKSSPEDHSSGHSHQFPAETELIPSSPVSNIVSRFTSRVGRPSDTRDELLDRSEVMSSFNHDVDWEQAENPNLISGKKMTEDSRVTGNDAHKKDVEGHGFDKMVEIEEAGYGSGRDTKLVRGNKEVLLSDLDTEGKASSKSPIKHGAPVRLPTYVQKLEAPEPRLPPRPAMGRMNTAQLGFPMLSQLPALPDTDDTDIGGPALERETSRSSGSPPHPLLSEIKRPMVDRDCMQDPLHDAFASGTWHEIAENNTKIYRTVFRCMPDNLVRDWKEYNEYVAYEERFNHMQGNNLPNSGKTSQRQHPGSVSKAGETSGPPGAGSREPLAQIKAITKAPSDLSEKAGQVKGKVLHAVGDKTQREQENEKSEKLWTWAADQNRAQIERQRESSSRGTDGTYDEKGPLETVPEHPHPDIPSKVDGRDGTRDSTEQPGSSPTSSTLAEKTPPTQFVGYSEALNMNVQPGRRRRRATTRGSRKDFSAGDDILTVPEAEELLDLVQGHLVLWPYDWLEKVEAGGNWLYPFDQISPIEIYV